MVSFLVDAVLFDMDGTLIDSTPGVIAAWTKFSETYDLDLKQVLHESHGVRLVDSLVKYCHIDDPDVLAKEVIRFEEEVIAGGPKALPGVVQLLEQFEEHPELKSKWTIVTSATSFYAPPALKTAGIPLPSQVPMVTSEHVLRGKPFPDPYLEGARRCGVPLSPPSDSGSMTIADGVKVLVVEDAPSGIRSGHAAGAITLAVLTGQSEDQIKRSGAEPHYIVENLTSMSVASKDNKVEITLNSLV